jgi:hypothetical protein
MREVVSNLALNRRSIMSSRKKPQKPKRVFSKKNQARRAPTSLPSNKRPLEPISPHDPDALELLERIDLDNVAPPAPPGTDPEDVSGLGILKMSVVLKHFMQPYIDMMESDEGLPGLLNFAILAWNLALAPDHVDEKSVRKLLKSKLKEVSEEEAQAVVELILELVQRKHAEFEDDRRTIVNAQFMKDPSGEYRLLVASTMD